MLTTNLVYRARPRILLSRLITSLYISTTNTSVLIDYDLSAKVDSLYPEGYNHSFEERHAKAFECQRMSKSHDVNSVLYLMEKCATTKEEQDFVRHMKTGMNLASILEGLDQLIMT